MSWTLHSYIFFQSRKRKINNWSKWEANPWLARLQPGAILTRQRAYLINNKMFMTPVVAYGHKAWLKTRQVVGSIPTRESDFLLFNIPFFYALVWQRAALSSATQHATPPEFGGKWGTKCISTRCLLPTLLCAGYSVTLKKYLYINCGCRCLYMEDMWEKLLLKFVYLLIFY